MDASWLGREVTGICRVICLSSAEWSWFTKPNCSVWLCSEPAAPFGSSQPATPFNKNTSTYIQGQVREYYLPSLILFIQAILSQADLEEVGVNVFGHKKKVNHLNYTCCATMSPRILCCRLTSFDCPPLSRLGKQARRLLRESAWGIIFLAAHPGLPLVPREQFDSGLLLFTLLFC